MNRALKILTIVLVIVLISLISFIGIFTENLNEISNILPKYKFGMEYAGMRTFIFTVDTTVSQKTVYEDAEGNVYETKPETETTEETSESTETTEGTTESTETAGAATGETTENTETSTETTDSKYTEKTIDVPANSDDVLTIENYEKTKKIMQKRMENLGASEYNIRLNNENGKIIVEVPSDNLVKDIYTAISTTGHLEIQDQETKETLIDGSHVKNAKVLYSTSSGTSIYLQLEFDKEGKDALTEISKEYIQTTDEEGKSTTKNISVTMDDSSIVSTYFGDTIETGVLQIPLGQALTDSEQIAEYVESAENIKNVINTGELPIVYALENDNFIKSSITDLEKLVAVIVAGAILLISFVYLTIRFKSNGFFAGILNIGFVALLLIALRYTNVIITTGGIITLIAIYFVNLIMLSSLLLAIKNGKNVDEAIKEVSLKALNLGIHLIVLAIVFTFSANSQINSIGMIALWSIIVLICYNVIFTRTLYKVKIK